MDAETLRSILSNPAASPVQKQAAEEALAALGENPCPQPGGKASDPIAAIKALLARHARRDALWADIKARLPESDWRAAFEQLVANDPTMAYDDNTPRRSFEYWREVCVNRDAYDVRTYLLRHVIEICDQLPEYAFELRQRIQNFITDQRNRDGHN